MKGEGEKHHWWNNVPQGEGQKLNAMLLEQTCVLCKLSGTCTAKGSSAFGTAPVWTGCFTQDSRDSTSSGHCQVDKEQQGRRTMFQQMKSHTKQVF